MYHPGYGRRNRLFSALLLLTAFALGVHAERRGWLPSGRGSEPPEMRQTFRPFWETWWLIHKNYVDQDAVNNERMTHGAILGMLATLGDNGHTTYLTSEEVKRLRDDLKGELQGIGAVMSMRKQLPTIVQTMPKSPAREAGLRAGDVIVEVDGHTAAAMSLQQLVQHVRGPAGTKVSLKVLRGDPPKPVEFTIERARVDVPDVTWQMLPDVPLAHVAIRSFGERTDDQLREAISEAKQQGAKGLIIDVRGNPGGLKEQAVKVTSEFLKAGEVVFVSKDAHGESTEIQALPNGVALDVPMCLLIDEGSASSSEIFAGAIQDHQRGQLIGQRTVGTGTVLREFELSDGSAALLAINQWLTPKGRQIWHKGIAPDIKVELPPNTPLLLPDTGTKLSAKALADSKDKQLQKAVEVLKKALP